MVIGMIGAFLFILIQLVLLVDFAHAWNERWLGNYEESQSRVWFTGITVLYIDFAVLLDAMIHGSCTSLDSRLPWNSCGF